MSLLRKIGRTRLTKLPDGRKQAVDRFDVRSDAADPATLDTLVFIAWGTAHPKYTTCLLVRGQELSGSPDQGVEQPLLRIYEELAATGETVVGGDVFGKDSNGRRTLTRSSLQLSSDTFVEGTTGAAISAAGTTFALNTVQSSDNGAIRSISRQYIEATTTLTQIGPDRVSRDPDGRKTIEAEFIQLRAGSTYAPGTPGAAYGGTGCVFSSEVEGGDIAVRKVTRSYLQATASWVAVGPDKTDRDMNGLLRVRHLIVAIAGTTPPELDVGATGYAVGDTTVYLARYSDAESDTAISRITAEYMEAGITDRDIRLLGDGTQQLVLQVFWTGADDLDPQPEGIREPDHISNELGFPTHVYTWRQSIEGGDPTDGLMDEREAYVDFMYPGIATSFEATLVTTPIIDILLKPPVEALIPAMVQVSYNTTGLVGELEHPLWNPTSWARIQAQWLTGGGRAASKYETLRGFRTDSLTTIVYSDEAEENKASMMGSPLYTYGFLTLSGGPEDPVGGTYTLGKPACEFAFAAHDGTKYYRRMVVVALIPDITEVSE